jgi:hypothetical protein
MVFLPPLHPSNGQVFGALRIQNPFVEGLP